MTTKPSQPNREEWEKRIDHEFVNVSCPTHDFNNFKSKIKSIGWEIIAQALAERDKEIMKNLENLRIGHEVHLANSENDQYEEIGFNTGIDEAIASITEENK